MDQCDYICYIVYLVFPSTCRLLPILCNPSLTDWQGFTFRFVTKRSPIITTYGGTALWSFRPGTKVNKRSAKYVQNRDGKEVPASVGVRFFFQDHAPLGWILVSFSLKIYSLRSWSFPPGNWRYLGGSPRAALADHNHRSWFAGFKPSEDRLWIVTSISFMWDARNNSEMYIYV